MTGLPAPVTRQGALPRDARALVASPWFHIATLALAVLVTYWGVWNSYFYSDDFWAFGWMRFRPTVWDGLMTEMELGTGIRPLMDVQLWLRFNLFGLDPAPYFLTAIAQHLVVVALTYWLATLLGLTRLAAWLGALLFATSPSASSVVHWITGSNMSLGVMFGLLAFCLFVLFRRDGKRPLFVLWLLCIGVMLFTNEYFATVLPMFVVYDLVIALRGLEFRQKARKLLVHLSYLVWLIPYAVLQLHFASRGSSEYAELAPGLDILMNYGYLFYLVLPYVPGALSAGMLSPQPTGAAPALYALGAMVLVAVLLVAAIYVLWRGTRVQRLLLIWMVLSFLPFALWPFSHLSAAPRYRYVPSLAFSILVASALAAWWSHARTSGLRWSALVPAFVLAVLLSNLSFHQIDNSEQVRRGAVKREVVERLLALPVPPEDAEVILEIPDSYFDDLAHACELVYPNPMPCVTTLKGEGGQVEAFSSRYWMKVSYEGVQVSDDWHR